MIKRQPIEVTIFKLVLVFLLSAFSPGVFGALNRTLSTKPSLPRVRCDSKEKYYTDKGKFGTDLYIDYHPEINASVSDPQLYCQYLIRSNQPTVLYWLHLSKRFDGEAKNCSQTKNIIAVNVGCLGSKRHCITNKSQQSNPLYSADGCFDITVSTSIHGDGFMAFFERSQFLDDGADGGNEMESSSFSDNFVYIVVGPVMVFIALVIILCVLMRRKQQKRLQESIHSEQKLIYQPISTSESPLESLSSPPADLLRESDNPRVSRISNAENPRLSKINEAENARLSRISVGEHQKVFEAESSRLSKSFNGKFQPNYYLPPKRVVYVNRYSQRPVSEYRQPNTGYFRSSSGGSQQRPHSLIESSTAMLSNAAPQTPEDWDNLTCSPQQKSQTAGSSHQSETDDNEENSVSTTHFIENPLEQAMEPDAIVPVLVPLRDHENTKRLSRADRLSYSIDSVFDDNIMCVEIDEDEDYEQHYSQTQRLIRSDSSDSYFDKM